MSDVDPLERWRLVLGEAGEPNLGALNGRALAVDAALDWLYGQGRPEPGQSGDARRTGPRHGGSEASQLTVPDWINAVHDLFPSETIERLERDAVEVYGITEVVTNETVLDTLEPNPALLRAVLQTKHLMNEAVLAKARELVRKVVERLMDELAQTIESRFAGVVARQRSSRHLRDGPLDLRRTLKSNLHRYDPETGRVYLDHTFHHLRRHRRLDRWQVIVVVDQSGSMLNSTIHAAITAAVLTGLPGIDSHLVAFDTEVVDLTSEISDPVATLMSVQLGGGTFIAKAMQYAASLVRAPQRAIICLITDFFEGDSIGRLESVVAGLVEQGTQVLGLAALDREAVPVYDQALAERLVALGAEVGAMTPGELAGWLAEKVRR